MKLLLDENLSRRLVPLLQPHYPEMTHVCFVGLERASDAEVRAFAATQGCVIKTRQNRAKRSCCTGLVAGATG